MPGVVDCCAVFLFQRVGHDVLSAEEGERLRAEPGMHPFSRFVAEVCGGGAGILGCAEFAGFRDF